MEMEEEGDNSDVTVTSAFRWADAERHLNVS